MSQSSDPSTDQAWALLRHNNLDAARLTEHLAAAGFTGEITELVPGLVGTGQVGENVRCLLTWDREPATVDAARPRSVVIKLASSNETSRQAAAATGTYIREVGFYRDLARSVKIRVPTVFALSEDRAANSFVLVMEDIAPASVGDQLAGCSLDQARLAMEAAANLHGSTWGREDLVELDWLDESTEERRQQRVELFAMLYPGFEARYRHRLSEAELAFGSWLSQHFGPWMDHRDQDSLPSCLVHGDFRLDNMLFGTSDDAPALTTVDWQTPAIGNGLSDVAYFLSGSLTPETLRAETADLLADYRTRLEGHGVTVSPEAAMDGFRAAAPAGFVMAVVASQLVGQTERGDDMFMVMAKGSAALATDLGTPDLLT